MARSTTHVLSSELTERSSADNRKVHLFDVNLPTVQVEESAVFGCGESPLVFDMPECRVGVAICYDVRFPAVFGAFEAADVDVVALPAAFSETTGKAHWDLVMRSRAVDYQVFLAAACPAPSVSSAYRSYGHSLVVDPWGTTMAQAETSAETLICDLRAADLERIRAELPLRKHRRPRLYSRWSEQT